MCLAQPLIEGEEALSRIRTMSATITRVNKDGAIVTVQVQAPP
jgi:hypothetical protein